MMGRWSGVLGRFFFGSGAISPLFRSSRRPRRAGGARFPGLFVEDRDGGVSMGHKILGFCARWIEVLWALWRFARDWLFLLRILNTVVLRVHKAI